MILRDQFFQVFQAAVIASREDYARALAADWLSIWPGDGQAQMALARVEVAQKLFGSAIERLQRVAIADPENAEAESSLAEAFERSGDMVQAAVHQTLATALSGQVPDVSHSPSWAQSMYQAIAALRAESHDSSLLHVRQVLGADINVPLPTLVAIRAQLALNQHAAAIGLARAGADRWPETVAFRIWLAQDLIQTGQVDRGVEYLHMAASEDPLGVTAARYLGRDHPYASLWPEQWAIELNRPIPAEVAAVLGDNRLAEHVAAERDKPAAASVAREADASAAAAPGTVAEPSKAQDEAAVGVNTLRQSAEASAHSELPSAQPGEAFQGPNPGHPDPAGGSSQAKRRTDAVLRQMGAKVKARRSLPDEDRRVPAYLVVSSRTRLTQAMGTDAFNRVNEAIDQLVKAVRPRPGWTAYKVYVDDPASLKPFGLSPVDPSNAWDIKLRLADIDESLARHSQMIGAVMIIGGHAIVPFHLLPNPTEDDDDQVPSDNPYATKDQNYFAPEWPVGRLPSDSDGDLLVKQLRLATEDHTLNLRGLGPVARLHLWLIEHFGRWFKLGPRSLGYSASIWRKASVAVFRSIGEPGAMMTSPPVDAPTLPAAAMRPTAISYYNLHGIADAPEWFGQRDPVSDAQAAQEYPVALRPQDVVNSGRAPKVVFSEACYGAHVIDKKVETALSLKFLASGTHAFVGSTKISYGSVTPPLIAADLLGRHFYEYLNNGLPAGEALRQAKLTLAREMHRRQGSLDGEDQKTLISFVMYGDPLYSTRSASPQPGVKTVVRRKSRPQATQTTCALGGPAMSPADLDDESRQRVKSILNRYLPGMTGAVCTIHPQHQGCDGDDHQCPTHQLGFKAIPATPNRETVVVTLSKHHAAGSQHHPHFARLTMDKSGKVLKLAVSR